MTTRDVKIIGSALYRELGWSWPWFFGRCLIRRNAVFRNTHWADEDSAEADFAKRLSISVAVYLNLIEKAGQERAYAVMREMLVPAGVAETQDTLDSLSVREKTGMAGILAYWEFSDKGGGMGQYNKGAFAEQDDDVLHYVVQECILARFYQETGTPELARLLCESDKAFWSAAYPGFVFHRGSSWENTIAFGKDRCEFVFERKP